MKTLAFFFALMISALHGVEEFVTLPEISIGERTYKAVTISLGAPNEAKIRHEDGSKFLDAKLLPEEIRKRLGYDPVAASKAVAFQRANAEASAKALRIANSPIIKIRVATVTSDGLLGSAMIYDAKGKFVRERDIFLATPTTGVDYVDESTYQFNASEHGTYQFTTVLGATRTIVKYVDLER